MKVLLPSTEVWGECPTTLDEAILWIEKAGRTCYRSEDKIVEGSGEKFVNNIIKRKHLSVIEHSNFVLKSNDEFVFPLAEAERMMVKVPSNFLHLRMDHGHVYIGGNFRAWMEATNTPSIRDLFEHPLYDGYSIATEHDDIPRDLRTVTAECLTDRAVTHEFVRHRPCAFSQESQRYCSYKKHLEVILPQHYADIPTTKDSLQMQQYQTWVKACEYAENSYKELLRVGERAEQARSVLPNSTATKIVCTANAEEWDHIFAMRTSPAAYPAIRSLINPVKEYFLNTGLID